MFDLESDLEYALEYWLDFPPHQKTQRVLAADIEYQIILDELEKYPDLTLESLNKLAEFGLDETGKITQALLDIQAYFEMDNDKYGSKPNPSVYNTEPYGKALAHVKDNGFNVSDATYEYVNVLLDGFKTGFTKLQVIYLANYGYKTKDEVLTLMDNCKKYLELMKEQE